MGPLKLALLSAGCMMIAAICVQTSAAADWADCQPDPAEGLVPALTREFSADFTLEKQAEDLQSFVERNGAAPIAPDKLDEALRLVDAMLQEAEVAYHTGSGEPSIDLAGHKERKNSVIQKKREAFRNYRLRIQFLGKAMARNSKVLWLTPELKKALKLGQRPDGGVDQRKLLGFYVPLTHQIMIDPSLSERELAKCLLHELTHAYQYTYRFPEDVAALAKTKHESKTQLDIASFYYELQANYYTLKAAPPKEWEAEYGTNKVWNTVKTGIGGLIAGAGVGTKESQSRFARAVNELDGHESNVLSPFGRSKAYYAFNFLEPVVIRDYGGAFSFVNNDMKFQEKHSKAVERTYFGKLSFAFQEDRSDQKLYVALDNNYYRKIGLSRNVDEAPECVALLKQVMEGGRSPMLSWLKASKESMDRCPAYAENADPASRKSYEQMLSQALRSENSPFQLGHPSSSEGSRPDLLVRPNIHFFPDYEVMP